MKNLCKQALIAATVSISLAVPQLTFAEAVTSTGAGTVTADARVDFQIVIPGVLRFRVGSPAAAIDLIEFAPTPANMGDGTDLAAFSGGDVSPGNVTVDVLGNVGQVTITHDSNGITLDNGLGDSIPYTEILTASSDAANLDAPALGTAGFTTPTLTGSLTNESAVWTYTYDNTASYAPGIYGGVNTNGGRVTYTASSP